MRRGFELALFLLLVLGMLCACSGSSGQTSASSPQPPQAEASGGSGGTAAGSQTASGEPEAGPEVSEGEEKSEAMKMKVDGTQVTVEWEENESAAALRELCAQGPLTVPMGMYGDFEQVGDLGASLPSDDVRTTTGPGDIVLYTGSQMVVFYGSNTWSYTRLGRITGLSGEELTQMLGQKDVTVTLSIG